MKNLVSILVLFVFSINLSFSQTETCDCKTDLDFVVEKMRKMPSYKKQIKGDKATQFENTYKMLSNKMKQPIGVEACYKLLLQQMDLVNDNHFNLYITDKYQDDISKVKQHPKSNKNIIELKEELLKKDENELEGTYNYGEDLLIGIYFDKNNKDLTGVVLESKLAHWQVGDISFQAYPVRTNKYNVYQYRLKTKAPRLVKSISFENGRLLSYKKVNNTFNFELPSKDQAELEFKQLNDNTQYLYFGNFSNSKKREHRAFFEDTKNRLTAQNIIIDLRSNTGGNKKFSDPFLKLLKNKNVYIITNAFTVSNGEQFTTKLKKLKNAKHLGQATFGIISYGLNYGTSYTTPSGYFSVLPTDMNFHEFFEFESKGVAPEFPLDFNSDWIEQTLEIIKADTK
ncbi:S41 family peptidase [Lacinutrix salivirga]